LRLVGGNRPRDHIHIHPCHPGGIAIDQEDNIYDHINSLRLEPSDDIHQRLLTLERQVEAMQILIGRLMSRRPIEDRARALISYLESHSDVKFSFETIRADLDIRNVQTFSKVVSTALELDFHVQKFSDPKDRRVKYLVFNTEAKRIGRVRR